MANNVSTVYFTRSISPAGILQVAAPLLQKLSGKVGVKVHFGEDGNPYYVKPDMFRELVLQTGGSFIESNVLYRGPRRETASHIALANKHGFGYAPIDIIDSEGEAPIMYKGKHFDQVFVGKHIHNYDSFLVISHFKGHCNAGFGGAIKNVGMGLAAIPGKMAMHAGSRPQTTPHNCIECGACVDECPEGAVQTPPLMINEKMCIACGKCVGKCRSGALSIPWGATGENGFMERLADYAHAIVQNKPAVYINVLAQISPDCDCFGEPRAPFVDDIGIVASDDMLAIDTAACDLVNKAMQNDDAFLDIEKVSGRYTLEYAHSIGMGNLEYELVTL